MKTIRVKIEHLCFSSWLATLIALLQAKQILRSSPLIRASIGCGTSLASRYSILDFCHADGDHIDLSVIDANSSKSGNQAFHFAAYHRGHSKAQWYGVIRVTADNIVQVDINGDGKADFEIAVHGDHLTKADFIV